MIHPMSHDDALFWSLRPIEAERVRARRNKLPASNTPLYLAGQTEGARDFPIAARPLFRRFLK